MKNVFTMKRAALLCAGLGAVGLAATFAFTGTSALFTSTADSQNNSITAGTVALTVDQAKSTAVHITGYMPGDGACYSSTNPSVYNCNQPENTYYLTYSGNPAFVGLDFTVSSTAANGCPVVGASQASVSPNDVGTKCTGTGQSPLFNGSSGAGDLDLVVTPENGQTAHQLLLDSNLVNPVTTCSTDANSVVTCTATVKNVLMPVNYGTGQAALQWVNGSTDWVRVDSYLPITAGNQFQGSGATFTLTSHAVQYANNQTTKGGTPDCDAATTFPSGLGAAGTYCPISWS